MAKQGVSQLFWHCVILVYHRFSHSARDSLRIILLAGSNCDTIATKGYEFVTLNGPESPAALAQG